MRKLFATFVLLLSLSYGSLKHIDLTSGLGIIGGTKVPIKEVPFMAIVLADGNMVFCGGTIVGKQHVLTAGHCCSKYYVESVTVGTDDRLEGGQSFQVEHTTVHPNYNKRPYDSDICVIKLQTNLSFSDTVKPIDMANKDFKLNEGELLETIGFGQIGDGYYPEKLRKVSLPYIPHDKCNKIWMDAKNLTITENMLCAGGLEGKGICFGDSGSPMFHNGTVVGLTNFHLSDGKSCDESVVPAVFARISALRPFIDKVMNEGF